MRSKNIVPIILYLVISLQVPAQLLFEGQAAGANFLGFSVNTGFKLPLEKSGKHALESLVGLGFMVPPLYPGTAIIHAGLHYRFKGWGLGSEVSGFTGNPFSNGYEDDFVDVIVYPNISYTIEGKKNWYYRMSVGVYLAYSRYYNYNTELPARLEFEGDPIPGAGFSIGYRFSSCGN